MRVEITQHDIDKAVSARQNNPAYEQSAFDPIRKAIADRAQGIKGMQPLRCLLSYTDGQLITNGVGSYTPFCRFDLPARVVSRLVAWDRGQSFKPFGFDLDIGLE